MTIEFFSNFLVMISIVCSWNNTGSSGGVLYISLIYGREIFVV